jgi:hypothetical protein
LGFTRDFVTLQFKRSENEIKSNFATNGFNLGCFAFSSNKENQLSVDLEHSISDDVPLVIVLPRWEHDFAVLKQKKFAVALELRRVPRGIMPNM